MSTATTEAPREHLLNANYLKVMIANFMMFFAFYLLTPLLPLYMTQAFGATKDVIGIVLSGYSVIALLVRPFSGYIVDTFPRKKVLMVCFWSFALFFGGYIAAGTLLWFALFRILHGGPFGALTVANTTVAIDVLPSSRRNEGLALFGVSNNIAMAVAPTMALWIYHATNNFQILFWIALAAAFIGLAADALVKSPQRPPVLNKQKLSLDRFLLLRGLPVGANLIFFGFCIGVFNYYLAIYSEQERGITEGAGTFYFLLAGGLILSRFVGRKSVRAGKLSRNAGIGIAISTLAYLLFIAVPTHWSYYLTAVGIGIGNGLMFPGFQNMMINMADHSRRGTANSTTLTAWDLGLGLGILFGGVIAEHWGFASVFWTCFGVHLAGLILYFAATQGFFERHKLR